MSDSRNEMARSVAQLLFSYLPEKTVSWEDGAGIVRLGSSRLDAAWPTSDARFVLSEVGAYLARWRERQGLVDRRYPSVQDVERFTVGTPRGVEASVLEAAAYCRSCHRFFPKRPRSRGGQLNCPGCGVGQSLRQVGFVFVHGCGEMVPIGDKIPIESSTNRGTIFWAPIRCATCPDGGVLHLDERTERLSALTVTCERCRSVVTDRFLAKCPRCFPRMFADAEATGNQGQLAFQTAMRITRHSANNAYYPHTITILRLDRPRTVQASATQEWLDSLLPAEERTGATGSSQSLAELVQRLGEAERRGDAAAVSAVQAAIALAVAPQPPRDQPVARSPVVLQPDVVHSVREAIALLSTVRREVVRPSGETSGGHESSDTLRRLGVRRLELVSDLPVVTTVFGFSRRSSDPTYQEQNATAPFPTTIRPFPVLDQEAARRLGRPQVEGTVPVFAREGLHEGLAVYLEPERVLEWLALQGISLAGDTHTDQMTTLLGLLEQVERGYDDIWERPVRRLLWGLLHSVSHCAMKAVSRVAGLETTGVSEYVFLPLLCTVIYSTATMQLGGIEGMATHRLGEFLDCMREEAERCLYDPDCINRVAACHGCIHSPDISCRTFNHGLARSLLVGGRRPWAPLSDRTRVVGYWEVTRG